jgi:hypothetical protein
MLKTLLSKHYEQYPPDTFTINQERLNALSRLLPLWEI